MTRGTRGRFDMLETTIAGSLPKPAQWSGSIPAPIAVWRQWIGHLRSPNSSHSPPAPRLLVAGSDNSTGEGQRRIIAAPGLLPRGARWHSEPGQGRFRESAVSRHQEREADRAATAGAAQGRTDPRRAPEGDGHHQDRAVVRDWCICSAAHQAGDGGVMSNRTRLGQPPG